MVQQSLLARQPMDLSPPSRTGLGPAVTQVPQHAPRSPRAPAPPAASHARAEATLHPPLCASERWAGTGRRLSPGGGRQSAGLARAPRGAGSRRAGAEPEPRPRSAARAAPPGRAGLLRPAQLPLRARVTSAPAGTARRLRGAGPLPSGPRRGSAGAGARKCVPGSAAPLPLNPSFCLPVPASWNSRFQLPLVWAAGLSLFAGSLGPTVRG